MTTEERFWSKVDKSGECWLWTGAQTGNSGYGRIRYLGVLESAHRVSYELSFGPIPAGMHVCHHCDNRLCVRPDHLFAGTRSDNMRDCAAKGRLIQQKNRKLTQEQIAEIRSRYIPGIYGHRRIAKDFGVHHSTIEELLKPRHKKRGWDRQRA